MKIQVSELECERLDKWVALARGWIVKVSPYNDYSYHYYSSYKAIPADSILVKDYRPSINGWQALELVKEFGMDLFFRGSITWQALLVWRNKFGEDDVIEMTGPTPEIASCRAVVASKFGEYVEEEL